ncbi:MAG: tRNA (N6-isopentenyl adenosine(37)-C2)-methylthiotransferase MiaB, partial [Burkholderiales bacterium]
QLIEARRKTGKPQVDISFPEVEKFDHLPPARVEGATAFVSIMEGCSKYCTFCVVPYTRGEEVSRPFDGVLTEVAELALQGVKEITLLGQNVNAYRATTEESDTADFALLLEYIADIPGIERIRYTTSHPKEFTQRLIDAYAKIPKLVNQVHLPVQSGSDRVLAAMKRGYTVLEYKSIIRRLREKRPDISISSDFIVGFPGETSADFEATMRLIDDVKFDGSYNFVYSRRPGTPAADLADDTPNDEKLARVQRLQSVVDEQSQSFSRAMLGTRQRVLVTGPARRENQLTGRTDNNRVVNFDGPVSLTNRFVEVTITEALRYTLRGERIEDTQAAV